LLVIAAMATYYILFLLPPRLVGGNDPDRYYHLGLSALIAKQGLLRTLPQVEDLGWGHYFPDKEFLFHAVTGFAQRLGGPDGVMSVVPLAGISLALLLYWALLRVLTPGRAAAWLLAAMFLNPVLLFRMTMLRPHLFAIVFFSLLLVALLRRKGWLAAVAAAGFAMSYHAFYMPMVAIGIAFLLPLQDGPRLRSAAAWALAGLVFGTVLNPYFPSNLVMSAIHLKLALGIGTAPGMRSGEEVQPISLLESVFYFGFLLVAVVGAGVLLWRRRLQPSRENAELWLLFLLTLVLTALSLKNSRACEYATPSGIVLVGYCLARIEGSRRVRWLLGVIATLALVQGPASYIFYQDCWLRPQGGDSPAYLAAVQLLPDEATGKKVFNCQWEAGSYLLFARPDVRFVDLLEPAMLWNANPHKYALRLRLIYGLEKEPSRALREGFGADYVLCGTPAMNAQMDADPRHFLRIVGPEPRNPLHVYKVVD
jgi:hypothetical protein